MADRPRRARDRSGLLAVAAALRRNSGLARLVASYAGFILTEYTAWIAVLVLAYDNGGPSEAGVVALVQLVPAALLAPALARTADRRSPVRLLVCGYLAQAAGMATAAAAAGAGQTLVAYGAAVVASTAVVTTRPGQAALLPSLARTAEDLTSANVALGWAENTAVVLAGLTAGTLLVAGGPALALAVMAILVLGSAALVTPLRAHSVDGATQDGEDDGSSAETRRMIWANQPARLLIALLTSSWVVVGALDVLYVVLALEVLQAGQGWVGYLQTGVGVGGVLASGLTALLVGRPLGVPILAAGLALSVALALTALSPGIAMTALLLGLVGACRALLDVAGRTLLQRTVPPHVLGRVFGLLEGMSMAGLAAGSLLVPALIAVGGDTAAILGVAAVLPLAAVVGGRSLLALDARANVPVVEITLLRSVRLFRGLPPPAQEGVAQALERRDLVPGTVLIREGDEGDDYYIVADGEVAVSRSGRSLGLRRRGEGLGEIALLRGGPRTATVTAATHATVYRLPRAPFLAAVTGNAATQEMADTIVEERLRDADPQGPGLPDHPDPGPG